MRNINRLSIALALVAMSACTAAPVTTAVETRADSVALATFESRWAQATEKQDRAMLDTLMADDWTITLADGRRSDKARAIKHWTAAPDTGVVSGATLLDSLEVRRLGPDAAVLTVAIADVIGHKTSAETTRTRVTDVVVRRAGRWQVLVTHESVLAPPALKKP